MRLDPHWSPEPDILVVCDAHRSRIQPKHLDGPPTWSSKSLRQRPALDLREKLPRYREAGIREIWLIDPFEHCVRADTKLDTGYATATLATGRLPSLVRPGLLDRGRLAVARRLPAPLRCVKQMLG